MGSQSNILQYSNKRDPITKIKGGDLTQDYVKRYSAEFLGDATPVLIKIKPLMIIHLLVPVGAYTSAVSCKYKPFELALPYQVADLITLP